MIVTAPFGATSGTGGVLTGAGLSGRRAVVTGASPRAARALAAAGADVTPARFDLADRASIAAFVAAWAGPLDLLVLGGSAVATSRRRTREGWDGQLAANHLGPFALSLGLHGALAAAGAANGEARVVVSSVGDADGEVLWDDLNFEQHPYDPWRAYRQSQTARVLFAVEAARRWGPERIAVDVVTPEGRAATPAPRAADPEAAVLLWAFTEALLADAARI